MQSGDWRLKVEAKGAGWQEEYILPQEGFWEEGDLVSVHLTQEWINYWPQNGEYSHETRWLQSIADKNGLYFDASFWEAMRDELKYRYKFYTGTDGRNLKIEEVGYIADINIASPFWEEETTVAFKQEGKLLKEVLIKPGEEMVIPLEIPKNQKDKQYEGLVNLAEAIEIQFSNNEKEQTDTIFILFKG